MRYVFGPVASRRLGLSLGLDITPKFTCTYSCVYCEVGRMLHQTLRRAEFAPVEDVVDEVRQALERFPHLDYLTITGSGEPTLHASLGQLIRRLKQITSIPVAVITNGSLLFQRRVREDLMEADLVIPSLDAVTQEVFERVNRTRIKVTRVIEGLRQFRKEYPGPIWLEILFVRGVNDGEEEVRKLAEVVRSLRMDRVQLNTVIRPPAEPEAQPLTYEALERIRQILGPPAEIIAPFDQPGLPSASEGSEQDLLELLERRGCTFEEISKGLGISDVRLQGLLDQLIARGKIRRMEHGGVVYYHRDRKGKENSAAFPEIEPGVRP